MTTWHPPARLGRLFAAVAVVVAAILPATTVDAARVTAGGYTTSGRVSVASVPHGSAVTVTVGVTASTDRSGLVDVEVYDGAGRKVAQRFWDAQRFYAGVARTYPLSWTVPANSATGTYRVDIGMFRTGWAELHHWNSGVTSFSVVAAPSPTTTLPTTTTTQPPTTTTRPPTTTTRPPTTTTAPPTSRFATLPPGSALPSDGECAARVRPTAEIRPQNATYNATRGSAATGQPGLYGRVTGNFTGTTDEIIQWAACKWGLDEDLVRAQTAKESWWSQRSGGDLTSDPGRCAPGHGIGVDGHPGQCPESWGVQQVRYPYWGWAFPWAITSTAYNLDAALASRRSCFEGHETWLNTVERGRDYVAGDLWGCIGLWFSGRWYTQPSVDYIAAVQSYLNQRIWTTPDFIGFRG